MKCFDSQDEIFLVGFLRTVFSMTDFFFFKLMILSNKGSFRPEMAKGRRWTTHLQIHVRKK